jgi:hypothetical protein
MGYRVKTWNSLSICRVLCLACSLSIAGCSWFGIERDPPQYGVIAVRLQSPSHHKKAVTYAQASAASGRRAQSAGMQRIGPDCAASFVVKMGTEYDVCIFADLNHNQAPDANEPAATAARLIPTPPTSRVSPVTLSFGCDGPVSAPDLIPPLASNPAPASSDSSIPAAALPYLDRMPGWLRDQIAR